MAKITVEYGDGTMYLKRLKPLLNSLGHFPSDEQIVDISFEFDIENGVLDFHDFIRIMASDFFKKSVK